MSKTEQNQLINNEEILQELWETKDEYAKSCSESFSNLVSNVKKDIQKINLNRTRTTNISEVA
ncbi:MAG: hypothetical protein D3914_13695 [Candidatus Electrothrix sp. LOE2]|jgi:two-component SAPR family response regulator|nr:hypothetical protein [Candidatus Electrothrix sp. LOE2]